MNRLTLYDYDDDETLAMQVGSARPGTMAIPQAARLLALGAVAGPVLFTLAWFILGFLSPGFTIFGTLVAPYSPVSQPVSGLGLGPTASFMNAAFMLGGLLVVAGSLGIFGSIREMSAVERWSGAVLLALIGLGMLVDGIFTLESILPHTAGFLLGSGTPVLSFLVIGLMIRRIPHWRRIGNGLLIASPLTLALLILYFATFDPLASGAGIGVGGLTQRILVGEVHAWLVTMGWMVFRRS